MRITLRSIVLTLAVLATAAFTTKTASAASNVRVPFNFNVNGKTLPAGTYSVQRDLGSSFVKLTSADSKFVGEWILQSGDANPTDTAVTLRFDEGDGTYALRSIQYKAGITGRLDKNMSEVRAIHIVHGR